MLSCQPTTSLSKNKTTSYAGCVSVPLEKHSSVRRGEEDGGEMRCNRQQTREAGSCRSYFFLSCLVYNHSLSIAWYHHLFYVLSVASPAVDSGGGVCGGGGVNSNDWWRAFWRRVRLGVALAGPVICTYTCSKLRLALAAMGGVVERLCSMDHRISLGGGGEVCWVLSQYLASCACVLDKTLKLALVACERRGYHCGRGELHVLLDRDPQLHNSDN